MPTLNWIGKDAVVRHHKDVPYRLLEPEAEPCDETTRGDIDSPAANRRVSREAVRRRYASNSLRVQSDIDYLRKALLPRLVVARNSIESLRDLRPSWPHEVSTKGFSTCF